MLNKLKQYRIEFQPDIICICGVIAYFISCLISWNRAGFYWLDVFIGLVIVFMCSVHMFRIKNIKELDILKELREQDYKAILNEAKEFDKSKEEIKNKIYIYKNKNTFNMNPYSR